MTSPRFASLTRFFSAACCLAVSLGSVSFTTQAQQPIDPGPGTVTLSSGGTCTYTRLTTYKTGGVYIECESVAPPASGAATVTLSAASGSIDAAAGGTVTMSLVCSGTCSGVAVSLTSSNASVSVTPSSPSFTGPGTQSVNVTGAPGIQPGTVQVTLAVTSNGTATGVTPSGSPQNVTIAAATQPTQPGTCSTNANAKDDSTLGLATKFYPTLQKGQSYALKFTPSRDSYRAVSFTMVMPAVATGLPEPNGYAVNYNISECPGDFARSATIPNCGPVFTANRTQPGFSTSTYGSAACNLDPSKTYYFNVQFVNSSGASSCPSGNCAIGLNISYKP